MKLLARFQFSIAALTVLASSAYAADGAITITSPANGATIQGNALNKLDFNVKLSPTGNHLHIYIDDGNPIIDRDIGHCPCSIDLPKLSPGKHVIAVKEATASHALTGVEGTVTVISQ